MAKEDVYQHNFRLSLNNPHHLRLHKQLLNVNKDIYKSKNDYMIRKLYEGVFGDSDEMPEDRLKDMEERIVQRVTKELLRSVLGMISMQPVIQPAFITPTGVADTSTEQVDDKINEKVASAALGYFDDWSDLDDE